MMVAVRYLVASTGPWTLLCGSDHACETSGSWRHIMGLVRSLCAWPLAGAVSLTSLLPLLR